MAEQSVQLYSHGDPQVVDAYESSGSANDWYAGDLVKLDTNGQVVIAAAGQHIIAGIARKAATGTQGTKLELELIDPNAIYVMRAEASTTPLQANVGDIWDIVFTPGAHTLNASAGTDGVIYIVGLYPETAANGTRVLVRFSTTKIFDSQQA